MHNGEKCCVQAKVAGVREKICSCSTRSEGKIGDYVCINGKKSVIIKVCIEVFIIDFAHVICIRSFSLKILAV